jgi:type IV secretory pathway VirB10-like protein
MHTRSGKRRFERKIRSIFGIAGTSGMVLLASFAIEAHAQISPNPASSAPAGNPPGQHTVALSLPPGTPLQVALDRETRLKRVGQPLQGHLMQPVYAFDHLVLPLGTRVQGHVSKIGRPTGKQLTFSILNADFTPTRPIQVSFDQIVLKDGTHLPLHASVVPGSGQVIRLVDTGSAQRGKAKNPVSAKMNEAKQEWQQAVQQIHQPGKMHRALRIGIAQLPVHPQYIDAGTLYYADLQQPLNFGSEAVHQQELQSIGTPPPAGSLVRASLVTPLDSATTKHEAPVEAVVSKPLFAGDRLILPQGTLLHGSVIQVRPARHLKHNGELRIAFHTLELPNGSTFRVDTTLEGIQAGTSETLDSEGAAKATSPKSRYINTGIAVSLAMVGSGGKNDVGNAGPAAGGATAFRLVGIAVGLAVRSHTLAILMSAYGGSRSIYVNFFGPGRNISFPRDTTMEIGFGSRSEAPMNP